MFDIASYVGVYALLEHRPRLACVVSVGENDEDMVEVLQEKGWGAQCDHFVFSADHLNSKPALKSISLPFKHEVSSDKRRKAEHFLLTWLHMHDEYASMVRH